MATSRPELGPGDVLAGRYRLDGLVSQGSVSSLWRATDEVLARPVAIKVALAAGPGAAEADSAFLRAAGRAGTLAHPGLARVYDAALEDWRGQGRRAHVDVAYVVSEWVDGRPLQEVLADGPLSVTAAAAMAVQAAEAVATAHAAGLVHGHLHPGNVLLTSDGRVKITDTATAVALRAPSGPPRTPDDDTQDLAALLYAALTGRWPAAVTATPGCGLPDAPTSGQEPCSPRQVRAGVPRALDAVVSRGLDVGHRAGPVPLTSAAAFAAAVANASPVAGDPQESIGPDRLRGVLRWRPRLTPRLRRFMPLILVVALLLAVGATTFAIGRAVGALPGRSSDGEALAAATPSASPGAGSGGLKPLDLAAAPVSVRDYDPQGDQTESHSTVVNSFDKDPSTAWVTSRYQSDRFGGLKSGVGLLVDLGRPVTVRRVEVALTASGADLELRAADVAGTAADPLPPVVATTSNSASATPSVLSPPRGTTARYWVVWITKLPADPGGGYREGISELAFFVDR